MVLGISLLHLHYVFYMDFDFGILHIVRVIIEIHRIGNFVEIWMLIEFSFIFIWEKENILG